MRGREASNRVFLDLEYCYPGMTKERGRPSESEKRQVVQIAAIRFDANTGTERASFDVLTKPIYEKVLPDFFVELTAITQEMLERSGIEFPRALEQLVSFCGRDPVWTFNADWGVLRQNCGFFGIPFPFETKPFVKVKALLPQWGIDQDAYSSGTLHQAAGITMSGHVHNALFDVRSMAAAVHFFEHHSS